MQGRKTINDEIKRVKGPLQPCRITKENPMAQKLIELPAFPNRYGSEAKEIYIHDGYYLLLLGTLNNLNLRYFILYCRTQARLDKLYDLLDTVHETDEYLKLERMAKELAGLVMRMLADFGIPPVYASRIQHTREEKKNPFEQFLNV